MWVVLLECHIGLVMPDIGYDNHSRYTSMRWDNQEVSHLYICWTFNGNLEYLGESRNNRAVRQGQIAPINNLQNCENDRSKATSFAFACSCL